MRKFKVIWRLSAAVFKLFHGKATVLPKDMAKKFSNKYPSWESNETIIPLSLVEYEVIINQHGATRPVGCLSPRIQRALVEYLIFIKSKCRLGLSKIGNGQHKLPFIFCVKLVLRVEVIMRVFFSFLVINQTWYQGGKVHAQNPFFWIF